MSQKINLREYFVAEIRRRINHSIKKSKQRLLYLYLKNSFEKQKKTDLKLNEAILYVYSICMALLSSLFLFIGYFISLRVNCLQAVNVEICFWSLI